MADQPIDCVSEMAEDGFHAAKMRVIGPRCGRNGMVGMGPCHRMLERGADLFLPRYRQVALDAKAVPDLLHSESYPKFAPRGVEMSQGRHRQKHVVVGEPVTRADDGPAHFPAGIVEQQIAHRAEMTVGPRYGETLHHGGGPRHRALPGVHIQRLSTRG